MKFNDKLQKMRKKNNMSQETLSEKMNVTRQSVSKWESGSSYPDMEKIISLTKILNCSLEDLLDDGLLGDVKVEKYNIKDYINDFLKYITNLYNMLLAMTIKQKMICVLEMGMLALTLFIIGLIFNVISISLIFGIIDYIPILNGSVIKNLLLGLITIGIVVLAVMIWFHLLKIRYLNYYVTIEDQGVKERVIEKEITNNKEVNHFKDSKEKKQVVIIRDPKDKSYSFFNLFKNIIVLIIKCITIVFVVLGILSLLFLLFSVVVVFFHSIYNNLFLFTGFGMLGLILLNIIVLKLLINYLFNIKTRKNLFIILFFISIILIGINMGLTTVSVMNLEHINNSKIISENNVSKENIKRNIYKGNTNYMYVTNNGSIIIDFKITDIKTPNIKLESKFDIKVYENGTINYYYFNYNSLIKDLKNNKVRDNYYKDFSTITIELNEDDYNYVIDNE